MSECSWICIQEQTEIRANLAWWTKFSLPKFRYWFSLNVMQSNLIAQFHSFGPPSIFVFVFVCIICMYTHVCVLDSVQRDWKKFSLNFILKTYIDSLSIIGKPSFSIITSFSITPFFMVGFPNDLPSFHIYYLVSLIQPYKYLTLWPT
jgi:hypothetical protein